MYLNLACFVERGLFQGFEDVCRVCEVLLAFWLVFVKMFWQLRIVRRLGIFSEMKSHLYRRVQRLLSVSESQIESKTGLKIL